jgi:hypothetical protein
MNTNTGDLELKLEKELEEISKNITDKEIEEAYNRSEAFALVPVLKLIYHTTNIDFSKVFKIKIPLTSNKADKIPIGEIEINENTDSNKKCKIFIGLVESTYNLDNELVANNLLSVGIKSLIEETNEKKKAQLIQIITFLTHSVKLIFDNLKNKLDNINNFDICLDHNTTIYLDPNRPLRLGIKIKKIN